MEYRFITNRHISTKNTGEKNRVEGFGCVYGIEEELWPGYVEKVEIDAFKESIEDTNRKRPIQSCYNHNQDKILSNTASTPPLVVENRQEGIWFSSPIPATSYGADLKENLSNGNVSGASYAFIVNKDRWHEEEDVVYRTILEGELFELGPVASPAFLSTSVSLRETRDRYDEYRQRKKTNIEGDDTMINVESLRKKAKNLEIRMAAEENAEAKETMAKELRGILSRIDEAEKDQSQSMAEVDEGQEIENRMSTGYEVSTSTSASTDTTPRAKVGADYRSLYGIPKNKSLSRDGFDDFDDFLQAVANPKVDQRLLEQRYGGVSVPSEGGFSVPEMYAEMVHNKALESSLVMQRATTWPMTGAGETLKIPAFDDFDHSDGTTHGGFMAQWLGEGATATRSQPTLRQMAMKLKKMAIFTQISRELREGGLNYDAQLTDALGEAIGYFQDTAHLQGVGGGPLGLLNDPALVVQDREGGQASGSIVYENLVKMLSRLHPSAANGAVWLASQDTIPQLLTLSVAVGTGGSFIPVLSQQGGVYTILTKPVLFTEKLGRTLGEEGDIVLANLKHYYVLNGRGLQIESSNSVSWLQDLVDIRGIIRQDGMGSWSQPFTPATSGPTLSWVVTLQERP